MKTSPVARSIDTIQADILSGTYEPGSRLPPERKLAQLYGVGRVSIRSALAKLTTSGLLEVRQGSGYRVRDYRKTGGPNLVSALVEVAATEQQLNIIADLLAVRRHYAQLVLHRLAQEPPTDTLALRHAIHHMDALIAADASVPELAQADLYILQCFVGMTNSDALQLCVNPLSTLISQLPVLQNALYASPRINVAAWTALADWLDTPDPASIPQFMRAIESRDRAAVLRLNRGLHS